MKFLRRMCLPICVVAMLAVICGAYSTAAAKKPSPFTNQSRPMQARVTILAISSSSRQNFAGNQDVYLADMEFKGSHQFVKLVDQYPGFGLPIRRDLLRQQQGFRMAVTREPECDASATEIYLRQGESSVFNGSVGDTLASHAADSIQCYKTLHQTIRIAKN